MWNILAVILYVSQLSCLKITPREKGDLPAACRLFSRGVIFTRARVSLPLLSLRKNGGELSSRGTATILHKSWVHVQTRFFFSAFFFATA